MKGCKCQKCGDYYKVDLMVPNKTWSKITPKNGSAGLLCGKCIIEELEKMGYNSFKLTII